MVGEFLIVGIGNSLRRDDGAGLLLADALAEAWASAGHAVRVVKTHQLMPEIALEIVGEVLDGPAHHPASGVLFVDAAVDRDAPTLEPVHAAGENAPAGGHTLGPRTVLLYAQALDARLCPAWLLTIPAVDLSHGEGLSPVTHTHLETLRAGAAQLWRRLWSTDA